MRQRFVDGEIDAGEWREFRDDLTARMRVAPTRRPAPGKAFPRRT
jgi:hypothetical protein